MSEAAHDILPENAPVQAVLPPEKPKLPMKWHFFLVRVYLWMAAIFHLLQAGWIFTGKIYIEAAARDAIYDSMPGMRILDYTFAALLAVGAILQGLAALKLVRKRKTGISLLTGAYILLILSIVVYLAARLLIAGMPPVSLPLVGQAVSCLALLGINRSYYRRRL